MLELWVLTIPFPHLVSKHVDSALCQGCSKFGMTLCFKIVFPVVAVVALSAFVAIHDPVKQNHRWGASTDGSQQEVCGRLGFQWSEWKPLSILLWRLQNTNSWRWGKGLSVSLHD